MDEFYMEMALKLAQKGIGKVNPNPLVGAVIVKNGEVIGTGYHKFFGGDHAERDAVKNAAGEIAGSTLYVTLEPCSHYGKTPPCVDLVIEKKFKRVVIGMQDPNPLVAGKSIKKLKDNGIEVTVGIKEEQCREMNEIFIKYITEKIPFVILKSAMSLDGKITTVKGESKWITSEEARNDGHKLRNRVMAIMAGVNTVIDDDPQLTCRIKDADDARNPMRVIVDSRLRIPIESKVIQNKDGRTIIAATDKCDKDKKAVLESLGVKVIEVKEKDKRVDLKELMKKLGELAIDSVLIEGGSTINFSALQEGIVDKVRFYIAPKIIGGEESKSSIGGSGFAYLKDAVNLKKVSYENIGDEIVVEGYL